jgi:uncharacterized protein (UPF0332 family)
VIELQQVFLAKAEESLAGAESEFTNRRYNNVANRCYYAVFQAGIYALSRAGIRPPGGPTAEWGHALVQRQFVGELINRRHLYPTELRAILRDNQMLRQRGDYEIQHVSQTQALRALRRSRQFIDAIQQRGAI